MGEYHPPTLETEEQRQTIAGYNNAALHHPPSQPPSQTQEEQLSFYKIAKS